MATEQTTDEYQREQQEDEEEEEEDEEEESPESSPPSKVARFSADKSCDADVVTTAVASPLVLGLGLAVGGKEVAEVDQSPNSSAKVGFTFMQMQEFHHQALIFKHMVAGIPVPIHLILPIWKSVAASYGPHHYPSFVGLGSLCYDFRNSMEPEPGRCRRTDGKKWRCSRDVVPDQKYCERHMHRGRNRSRKPVEGGAAAAAAASTSLALTTTTNNNLNDAVAPTATSANSISSNDVSTARMIESLSSNTACKTAAS